MAVCYPYTGDYFFFFVLLLFLIMITENNKWRKTFGYFKLIHLIGNGLRTPAEMGVDQARNLFSLSYSWLKALNGTKGIAFCKSTTDFFFNNYNIYIFIQFSIDSEFKIFSQHCFMLQYIDIKDYIVF